MGAYPLECELPGDRSLFPLLAALSQGLGNVSYERCSSPSFPIRDQYLTGPLSRFNKKTQAKHLAEHQPSWDTKQVLLFTVIH